MNGNYRKGTLQALGIALATSGALAVDIRPFYALAFWVLAAACLITCEVLKENPQASIADLLPVASTKAE